MNLDRKAIIEAAKVLLSGGVVAIPTETVYGLAADARNAAAVRRVFELKGRPATNPLIVHIWSIDDVDRYATDFPPAARKLCEKFWPGPLSVVLPKRSIIVDDVTAGLPSVALRVPDHPLALELLREFDGPLAAPSANRSSHISPTTADHVRREFGDAVEFILDGGPCELGIESTVVSFIHGEPRLLRPGSITREQVEEVIGDIGSVTKTSGDAEPAESPGQSAKHYAPHTPAFRVDPSQRELLDLSDAAILELWTDDAGRYAHEFYARLRKLDERNLRAIYIEMPPDSPAWVAVRDRITRATIKTPSA